VFRRIVAETHVFDAERTYGCHLSDVLSRFCPMIMRRVVRYNNHATRRISLQPIAIELICETDVENPRDDCTVCGMSFTPDGTLTLMV